MSQIHTLRRLGLAGVLALASAGGALAQEAAEQPSAFQATLEPPVTELAPPPPPTEDLEAHAGLPDQALDDLSGRGGATVSITDQDLTSVSSGNTINAGAVGSGSISLQDNALAGFGGIGNFLMNTGHNNSLQSNVSVTIIVTQ